MSWSSGIQVKIVDGPGLGETTLLKFDRMTFGRARTEGAKADGWVLLADKAISRRHAEIVWDDATERYTLNHLSKTNLTWVDGQAMEDSVILQLGQKIRMGGTTLEVEVASEDEVVSPAAEPARPGKHEMTERLSVEGLRQAIALRKEDVMTLQVVAGPDAGKTYQLQGFHITVGRANLGRKELTGDPQQADFDTSIELTDEGVLSNHLLLKWDELRGGFAIAKNPGAPLVGVVRTADGFHWAAQLGDAGALVRAGDVLTLAGTQLTISKPTEETTVSTSVKHVPLSL